MKFVVATVEEIPPGERKIVDVAGRSLGIFNLDGEFFALRNHCPHQGGALCEGQLWGVLRAERPGAFCYEPSREILACPWHGWEFHIRTGQSWCAPERLRVKSYEVSVVDREQIEASVSEGDPDAPAPGMVKGPYRVETYAVAQQGAYLVVDVPAAGSGGGAILDAR